MKAVRVHEYKKDPSIDDIPEPKLQGPLDVIVKIGGAGVCRTDLHIVNGDWEAIQNPSLPYVIGHENAGWVHEVGDAVTNVKVGDTVILHPQPSCGLCLACRAGRDMQCTGDAFFPGLSNNDGGMAEYLRTTARACVKLNPDTNPADVAALADAGITAYHAVRKAVPLLYPGTTAVVIGAGGLGHIAVQALAALTATKIIVVDKNPDALKLASQIGADETVRGRRQPGRRGAGAHRRRRHRRLRLRRRAGRRARGLADDRAGGLPVRPRVRRTSSRPRRSISSRARRT